MRVSDREVGGEDGEGGVGARVFLQDRGTPLRYLRPHGFLCLRAESAALRLRRNTRAHLLIGMSRSVRVHMYANWTRIQCCIVTSRGTRVFLQDHGTPLGYLRPHGVLRLLTDFVNRRISGSTGASLGQQAHFVNRRIS